MNPTDAELVTQVLAGQQNQYRILVTRHSDSVFNAAYRLLGNRADAADVTQETFIRAYHALSTFRIDAPLKPWLCRIAANQSLNLLKRRRPTLSLDDHPAEAESIAIPDYSMEPQRALQKVERNRQLREAILGLPPPQRAIIELRHFQDQSYAEIAKTLDISVANVKVKLFRARKALRKVLQKEMEI